MPANPGSPEIMPHAIHGEQVISAFRHLPLYGQANDTYTVITLSPYPGAGGQRRYNVLRARFAPALDRWSIDTSHAVDIGLPWTQAAENFTHRIADRVS